jgi:hypothetical protein
MARDGPEAWRAARAAHWRPATMCGAAGRRDAAPTHRAPASAAVIISTAAHPALRRAAHAEGTWASERSRVRRAGGCLDEVGAPFSGEPDERPALGGRGGSLGAGPPRTRAGLPMWHMPWGAPCRDRRAMRSVCGTSIPPRRLRDGRLGSGATCPRGAVSCHYLSRSDSGRQRCMARVIAGCGTRVWFATRYHDFKVRLS